MLPPPCRNQPPTDPVIYPELRQILSPDLEPPALPADPTDCSVRFHVLIGPQDGGAGAAAYSFTVVTPPYLGRTLGHTWGRGYLIVDAFSWEIVVRAVARLLAQCARPTWPEVAAELDKELPREIDDAGGPPP